MTDRKDAVVAGGGIGGLALGYFLSERGYRVTVLEAAARPGGCIATARWRPAESAIPGGAWVELGAHTLYNSYRETLDLLRKLGLEEKVLGRRKLPYRLLEEGRLRGLFSALHWPELAASLPRLFRLRKEGKTVGEFYRSALGRRNYEGVFRFFFDAAACQPAESLAAEFFLKRRKHRDPAFPRSFSLEGGLESLAEALADALSRREGCAVLCSQTVIQITKSAVQAPDADDTKADGPAPPRFTVETRPDPAGPMAASSFSASLLGLALPPAVAAALLASLHPALAHHLGRIETRSLQSRAFAASSAPGRNFGLPPVAGLVPRAGDFLSLVSRDVSLPEDGRERAFTVHRALPAEAGSASAPAPNDGSKSLPPSLSEFFGTAASGLRPVGEKNHVLPALKPGHAAWLAETERLLRLPEGEGLFLTGNFFQGLSLEDAVARSAAEAARAGAPPT